MREDVLLRELSAGAVGERHQQCGVGPQRDRWQGAEQNSGAERQRG
jgi:hypothetical protein